MQTRTPPDFLSQTVILAKNTLLIKKGNGWNFYLYEFFLLVIFASNLVLLRKGASHYSIETEESPNGTDVINPASLTARIIHVVPDNEFARNFTALINQRLHHRFTVHKQKMKFMFHGNTRLLNSHHITKPDSVRVALVLPEEFSEKFRYTLKFNPHYGPDASRRMISSDTCREEREKKEEKNMRRCPVNKYYSSDLLGLQALIEESVLITREPTMEARFDAKIQDYPKPMHCEDTGLSLSEPTYFLTFIPLLSACLILCFYMGDEEGIRKRHLLMKGISARVYGLSWIVSSCFMGLWLAVPLTFIMYVATSNVNVVLILVSISLLILFACCFVVAMSQICKSSWMAIIFSFLIFAFMFGINGVSTSEGHYHSLQYAKILPPTAFALAMKKIIGNKCSGGLELTDIFPGGRGEETFYCFLIILLAALFLATIAIFSHIVFPDEYSERKRRPSSMKLGEGFGQEAAEPLTYEMGCRDQDSYWIEPISMVDEIKADLALDNISWESCGNKSGPFGNLENLAGVTAEILQKQVTAILGKRKSGKTTLINILAGVVAPTSGTICKVEENKRSEGLGHKGKTRKSFAPELRGHMKGLTVKEHLEFYGKLKGFYGSDLKDMVISIVTELKFSEKADTKLGVLEDEDSSKLSIGIAFMGDESMVLLDEPTRGCGHNAKLVILSYIENRKDNRTVVFSTSSAEDAEILGDRILILDKGRLKCSGSSKFLKQTLGGAHYLTLDKLKPLKEVNEKIPSDAIFESGAGEGEELHARTIKRNYNDFKTTIKYQISGISEMETEQVLNKAEELVKGSNGFTKYGICTTSLDDVFQKVTGSDPNTDSLGNEAGTLSENESNLAENCGEGRRNNMEIMKTLCVMRWRRFWRSFCACYCHLVVPIIFMLSCYTAVRKLSPSSMHPCIFNNIHWNQLHTIHVDTNTDGHSKPAGFGFYENIRIAVNEDQYNSNRSLRQFIQKEGFQVTSYSGGYQDLLEGPGTAAAINVLEDIATEKTRKLNTLIRINETYVHIPAIVFKILQSYDGERINSNLTTRCNYKVFCPPSQGIYGEPCMKWMSWIAPLFCMWFMIAASEFVRDNGNVIQGLLAAVHNISTKMYCGSLWCTFGGVSVLASMVLVILLRVFHVRQFENVYASSVLLMTLILHTFSALTFSQVCSRLFSGFIQFSSFVMLVPAVTFVMQNYFVSLGETPELEATISMTHYIFASLNVFYAPTGITYFIIKQYRWHQFRYLETNGIGFETYNVPEIWGLWIISIIHCLVYSLVIMAADIVQNRAQRSTFAGDFKKSLKMTRAREEMEEDTEGKRPLEGYKIVVSRTDGESTSVFVNANMALSISEEMEDELTSVGIMQGNSFEIKEGDIFGLVDLEFPKKPIWSNTITAINGNDELEFPLEVVYCPPVPVPWDFLTVKDVLELFATIQGVRRRDRKGRVKTILRELKLEENINESVKISPSDAQKLYYGNCMIGNPELVVLDDPCTYMDWESKQVLRNTLRGTIKGSRRAVLAMKSNLTEACAIATNVAVIVNGEVKYVGSSAELKRKYGNVFLIKLTLEQNKSGPDNRLRESEEGTSSGLAENCEDGGEEPERSLDAVPKEFEFVIGAIPGAIFLQKIRKHGFFYVPAESENTMMGLVKVLEKLKFWVGLEGYHVEQASLEDIFVYVPELLKGRDDECATECEKLVSI